MNENSKCVFLLRGISATGKGTRVSTLMEFLKTKYECEVRDIHPSNEAKPFPIATVFPEPNLTFLGRWVKSNKIGRLYSWSSLDGFSSQDKMYEDIVRYFSYSRGLFLEGYFGGKRPVVTPQVTLPMGFTDYMVRHYFHEDMEELQQRCLGRSGARIKGSCYRDNQACLQESYKIRNIELFKAGFRKNNIPESNLDFHFVNAKEPVYKYGVSALIRLGLDKHVDDFIEFSKENSTLRHVDNVEYNHKRFEKYMGGDSDKRFLIPITGSIQK